MRLTKRAAQEELMDERLMHLTPNERAALVAFVDRLRERYDGDLLRVVLFGSKARMDFDDESDLDVLVVMRMRSDDYREYWNEIVDIAWEIELTYGIVTSLIIKDEVGYANMRDHRLLLARNIEQDGVELWRKQPSVPTFKSA
ncbi:MAG: nucleotidyltransferase family protein [Anaerolineae bacterium]